MRPLKSTAAALILLAAAMSPVSAGMMSAPAQGTGTALLQVADMQMTVSNPYGYANLRQKPSTSSKLLAKLPQGTKVDVIEKVSGGSWVHVKADGKEGYIQTKLLK